MKKYYRAHRLKGPSNENTQIGVSACFLVVSNDDEDNKNNDNEKNSQKIKLGFYIGLLSLPLFPLRDLILTGLTTITTEKTALGNQVCAEYEREHALPWAALADDKEASLLLGA